MGQANSPVMMVGNTPLSRVEELRIPNRIEYFTTDEALLAPHRAWMHPHFLDDEGHFDLVFQSWIIEIDGRVVLIDPCTGNGKQHPVPYFDRLNVPFIDRMADSGYRPRDIDIVFCTHLHHDHCGWNTELRDGKWVPTFANARYVLNAVEYARWGVDRAKYRMPSYNEEIFERSVLPVMQAGLVDLVAGNHRLTPGLSIVHAPGHTIGHQILHLTSADRHALFTGDCFHHPIQLVDPMNPFGDPEDIDQIAATRRQLVATAVELDALLIPAHLPAPYAVRVSLEGSERRFFAGDAR